MAYQGRSRRRWLVAVGVRCAMVVAAITATACASPEEPAEQAESEERADPELVEVYWGVDPLGQGLGEDEGELIGPRFDLKIDEIASGDSFDDLFGSTAPEQLHAAEGRKLLAATMINRREVAPEADFTEPGGPMATIEVGDEEIGLDDMPSPRGVVAIVVSVPDGERAELRIDDGGRSQALDLRTGERTEQIDTFYTEPSQRLDHDYDSTARLPVLLYGGIEGDRPHDISLSFDEASRRHWAQGTYAADGRAWLLVSHNGLSVSPSPAPGEPTAIPLCDFGAEIRAENAFTLIEETGHEIPAEAGLIGPGPVHADLRFDVPENFTTGTLRIAPGASPLPHTTSGSCTWITPPAEQTIPIQLTETGDD